MATSFTASITILLSVALAALINNSYKASETSHLFDNPIFGLQSGGMFAVKFGSASLILLLSFLCSSMSIGYLIDANFLINAAPEFSSPEHTQIVFERGFMLAFIGSRLLCITFPLLLWLLGPALVALSSMALVWLMYEFDFSGKFKQGDKQIGGEQNMYAWFQIWYKDEKLNLIGRERKRAQFMMAEKFWSLSQKFFFYRRNWYHWSHFKVKIYYVTLTLVY